MKDKKAVSSIIELENLNIKMQRYILLPHRIIIQNILSKDCTP